MPCEAKSRRTRSRASAFAPTFLASSAAGRGSSSSAPATPRSATTCKARGSQYPAEISTSFITELTSVSLSGIATEEDFMNTSKQEDQDTTCTHVVGDNRNKLVCWPSSP